MFQYRTKNQWLVKRIADWPKNKQSQNATYFVLGDNSKASHDSRNFGGIERDKIVGEVKLVLLGINNKNQFIEGSYLQKIQ